MPKTSWIVPVSGIRVRTQAYCPDAVRSKLCRQSLRQRFDSPQAGTIRPTMGMPIQLGAEVTVKMTPERLLIMRHAANLAVKKYALV
jgi:hypothetical protein